MLISNKWVFAVKYRADGRPERFKARLVARGYSQQYGIDYEDTFAPVIQFDFLRVLLAIAAKSCMKIYLIDAQNTYFSCILNKKILMEVLEGVDYLERYILLVL